MSNKISKRFLINMTLKKYWFAVTRPTLLKTCRPKKCYCYATKEYFFSVPKKIKQKPKLLFFAVLSLVFFIGQRVADDL